MGKVTGRSLLGWHSIAIDPRVGLEEASYHDLHSWKKRNSAKNHVSLDEDLMLRCDPGPGRHLETPSRGLS